MTITQTQLEVKLLNKHKIDWYNLDVNIKLTEDFLRQYNKDIHWGWVSSRQVLSEEFLHEFKDNIDWDIAMVYQTVSEQFIIDHKEYLNRYHVSKFQVLSNEFILNNIDWLANGGLLENHKLSLTTELILLIKLKQL
jgi:hypothetical protein